MCDSRGAWRWVPVVLVWLGLPLGCGGPEHEVPCDAAQRENVVLEETEETYAALRAEIEALEQACYPAKGTPLAEIEARYGPGRLARKGKLPRGSGDDPHFRAYEFLPPRSPKHEIADATLVVTYDDEWRVKRAGFSDAYSTKGRIFGEVVPLAERLREARWRRDQLLRIQAEIQRRFGD